MKKIIKYCYILIFLGIYFLYKLSILSYSKDSITFLNVGNGDSILLKSNDKLLLIDGGTSSYSLNNLYKYTNYHMPSSFIISHPHLDHLSGLIPILNHRSTFYDIYVPKNLVTSKSLNRYFYNLSTNNFKTLLKGDIIYVGNFKLSVLWPEATCDNKDLNYCSLVLLIYHKNIPVLIDLSDVPKDVQNNLSHQVDGVDIIKVPHQGADNSLNQNFIKKNKPKYAVFSVGKNSYGHPHSQVLEYYKSIGTQIKRTDEAGDITFYFK